MNTPPPSHAPLDSALPLDSEAPSDDIQRKTLVFPFLAVGAIVGGIALADLLGARLNIHGGTGFLVLAAFAIGSIATVANAFLIPLSIARLRKHPILRTPLNYWAISLGTAFLLVFVAWVSFGFIARH